MIHKTLAQLQQPTMALIGSFYQMPPDAEVAFTDMMSIYMNQPTPEMASMLFDKVMGRETAEEKKSWLHNQAMNVPTEIRQRAEEIYIRDKNAVPKGLPTSGNLLVGLGIVSRSDKEALMDAQAAARILDHLERPDHVHLSQELFEKKTTGEVSEARPYLDKPFSTPIQRLEHLCAIASGYQVVQQPHQKAATLSGGLGSAPDIRPMLGEFQKAAVETLYQVSEKLSANSADVAAQIRELAQSCAPREEVRDWSFKTISAGMKEILPTLFSWHAPHLDKAKTNPGEDSYSPEERGIVEKMVQKRLTQVQSGLSMQHTKDRGPEK